MPPEQSPSDHHSTDIFSLSDRILAEKLQFVKEIGFGNWGSVWLCRPRLPNSADDTKLAVKLVHRSKTTSTAARFFTQVERDEGVRTFKDDPHPSIVPFHSFIITPSYALITMEFLPELVPVEVPESKAKEWFHSLLSGVQFLHSRGVVHNDIKPANILLSERQVPVLVDFGFAEKYDLDKGRAFRSNLTYGTPEYLSPERARGLPHDTRKADIWSLGVTFFEILIGRTPFEHTEGEPFATKAALEDYWARTMRGKWLGSWKMSKGVEKMLHRMIQPNPDLRYTAPEVLQDPYWDSPLPSPGNKKAASSGTPDRPLKSRNVVSPWSSRQNASMIVSNSKKAPTRQRVLSGTDAKRRPNVNAHLVTLPRPKENMSGPKKRPPKVQDKENAVVQQKVTPRKQPSARGLARKPSALGDRTVQMRNAENSRTDPLDKSVSEMDRSNGSVRNRMREWELERARLREMERVGESDTQDAEKETELPLPVRKPSPLRATASPVPPSPDAHSSPIRPSDPFPRAISARLFKPAKESTAPPTSMPPLLGLDTDLPMHESFAQNSSANESSPSLSLFKHSLKVPLGKTVDIFKSSVGLVGRRRSVAHSDSPQRLNERLSWETEILDEASLPVVRQAVRNQRAGADSQADRMTIWLQNIEKVVADARQNFASSNVSLLPALPVAPGPQTRRLSRDRSHDNLSQLTRPSRRALPANQIFQVEEDSNVDQSFASSSTSAQNQHHDVLPTDVPPVVPLGGPNCSAFPYNSSPRPTRRATVLGRSPEKPRILEIDPDMTPSKRREKSKSANDLNRLIRPISRVQFELDNLAAKSSLSAVLDRDLFTPDPVQIDPDTTDSSNDHVIPHNPVDNMDNSLTDSPFVVHPYPSRKQVTSPTMDSPTQRHLEGAYDRFLMATKEVKRVGKGYQSWHVKPISTSGSSSPSKCPPGRFFHPTRRPMPPPVSSKDKFMTSSAVELGVMLSYSANVDYPDLREDRAGAAKVVSRALKALVTGKTAAKKVSRTS
ncbi:hypothetical protein BJV74DRAFT_883424 [Russula compacta]|nr:hypothetical protein BJV74DRAFT_883424 [Russula compacta]